MLIVMKSMAVPLFALFLGGIGGPVFAAERNYSVTDFDRIQVEGPFEVAVASGRSVRARAIGSQTAIDRVSIDVSGRVLRIRPNRSAWGGYPGGSVGSVRIEVGAPTMRAATVIGSGNLAIDRLQGLKIDLSLSGSGRLQVAAVDADNLAIGLLGSGTVQLAGKARQLRATVQGSGDLTAERLVADDAVLTTDTVGRVVLGARRTARVTAQGSGEVVIAGGATCTLTGPAAGTVACGK